MKAVVLAVIAAMAAGCVPLECGKGVSLCGIVGVSSGLNGPVTADGIWVTTGKFGTSKCIPPLNTTKLGRESCVKDQDAVWERQGMCSGTKDAEDYFSQACSLAQGPMEIVSSVAPNSETMHDVGSALADAGYEIYSEDLEKDLITLTACASSDGTWKLSPKSEFISACGSQDDVQDQIQASSSAATM